MPPGLGRASLRAVTVQLPMGGPPGANTSEQGVSQGRPSGRMSMDRSSVGRSSVHSGIGEDCDDCLSDVSGGNRDDEGDRACLLTELSPAHAGRGHSQPVASPPPTFVASTLASTADKAESPPLCERKQPEAKAMAYQPPTDRRFVGNSNTAATFSLDGAGTALRLAAPKAAPTTPRILPKVNALENADAKSATKSARAPGEAKCAAKFASGSVAPGEAKCAAKFASAGVGARSTFNGRCNSRVATVEVGRSTFSSSPSVHRDESPPRGTFNGQQRAQKLTTPRGADSQRTTASSEGEAPPLRDTFGVFGAGPSKAVPEKRTLVLFNGASPPTPNAGPPSLLVAPRAATLTPAAKRTSSNRAS